MPTLFVRCAKCETEFPSGIAISSEEALKTVTMNGLRHRCPNGGADGPFFTKDYYLPAGVESLSVPPPDQTTARGAAAQEEALKLSGYGVGAH